MFDELLTTSKSALQDVETYLSFAENQLGRAALTRLYSSRTSAHNGSVTLIHGAAGMGKTHLCLWTLLGLTRRHPRLKFVCASTQSICESLRKADERQFLAELLEQFSSLDVFVCEDLHWIEQTPQLQPLLLMLVEALEEGLTQVLLTSRKPVGEIRSLDQRLTSRCHGGLCVGISMPGVESRTQLFQHWFRELKLPILKPFVASAKYLAERLPLPPRDLRMIALELAQRQRRRAVPIDVPYLERWLIKENHSPFLSFDAIVLHVAQEFGVEPAEIRSRSRQQGLAVPRQCAMWLTKQLTGRPLEQIGKYFDRSHTTVAHSLSRLEELLPNAPSLRQQVHKLRQQLKELPREDCA